jgi:hypothetical protein
MNDLPATGKCAFKRLCHRCARLPAARGALRPDFKQSFSIVFQTDLYLSPPPYPLLSSIVPYHFVPLIRPKSIYGKSITNQGCLLLLLLLLPPPLLLMLLPSKSLSSSQSHAVAIV